MSSTDIPCLPQFDPAAGVRSREIARARSHLRYAPRDENVIAPVAVASRLPLRENYDVAWAFGYLPQLGRSLAGVVEGSLAFLRSGRHESSRREALRALFGAGLETPPIATESDLSDDDLARCYLDGPNPLVLERVRSDADLEAFGPDRAARFEETLGGRALASALSERRLYRVDYRLLREAFLHADSAGRDSRWREKYLPSPVVLLAEGPAGARPSLALVAIRVDQPDATGHNPVYWRDRANAAAWRLAKTYVLVADFNLQAMCSHIFRHHFVMEPVALSAKRQLASRHPLRVLLDPHLAYTNAVNQAAYRLLEKPGSVFDRVYAGRLVETRRIMQVAKRRYPLERLVLEADLDARGVREAPVEYPFRDDALAWSTVIRRFVESYLSLYYDSDADLRADHELGAFLSELGDEHGGGLSGIPRPDRATVGELVAFVTHLLFTAGPGHASVHFPQTDYFTFAPNYPGAAYLPPPTSAEHVDEHRIERTLPPFSRSVLQFLNNQIAYYRFDRFGDYRRHALGRIERARAAIERLRVDLLELEATIEVRNRDRSRPYRYLLPSLVPNSINI